MTRPRTPPTPGTLGTEPDASRVDAESTADSRVVPPSVPLTQQMVDMLRRVSLADEPQQVLGEFAEMLRKLYGTTGYLSLSTRDLPPGHYRITRQHLEGHADELTSERIAAADPWSTLDTMPLYHGGFLGDIVEADRPQMFNDLDLRGDPVLGDGLKDFHSLLAVPLFDEGHAKNWSLQLKHERGGFNESDLERSLMRSNLVGGTVRLVQTTKQLREAKAKIDREMHRIGDIQRALLPDALPDIHGASVAATYQTYDAAGGDYYNVHPLGIDGLFKGQHNGRWGMMIADVSGHGPAAAVVMAMMQSMVMCLPVGDQNPAGVLHFLNRHLCSKRIEQTFVTAFALGYDPQTGDIQYARAGHPPAMIRRPHAESPGDDAVEILSLEGVGGLPLGIMEDAEYENAQATLRERDTLVLFTDGIVEARNPGGTFFGEEGIRKALRACSGEATCFIDTLNAHLDRFQAGGRPEDDQTALAMRVEHLGQRPATYVADGGGI
ncbi:MAG: SpoIIE family protein phosphatase [Planctomycetota bacterium]